MSFNLTVLAKDIETEKFWCHELSRALAPISEAKVLPASQAQEAGQIIFVDSTLRDLEGGLANIDRKGRAIFLIVREGGDVPASLLDGKVDDVLIAPFRAMEVLSKLKQYQQILMWEEVTQLNASFSEVLSRLQDDLKLAERLQKSKTPLRFSEVKGFKVASRYLAGMRAGGDHFDLAEAKEGNQLSMILSDSSSYGLSSAVLSILMKVALKLSVEEIRSCRETVRKIHEELALTLGEKDKLSLFYGVMSRKDYRLRYLNLGTSCAFFASPKDKFVELPTQGAQITQKSGLPEGGDGEVTLLPDSRLALISDGFVEAAGGATEMLVLLDRFRDADPKDALNEMVFAVKSKFTEPDDMPAQDCTAIIYDVDSRVMRMV